MKYGTRLLRIPYSALAPSRLCVGFFPKLLPGTNGALLLLSGLAGAAANMALPWLPLAEDATYWAVDVYEDMMAFVRGFLAFDELLELHPEYRGKVQFLALMVPSRMEVEEYQSYLNELMGAAGINSIESLRGNRDRLRGYMLDEGLMQVLDVQSVGA